MRNKVTGREPQAQLPRDLSRFEEAGLIRLLQAAPDPEYWFKHVLVQESLYGSLLKTTRASIHGRVAAALERSAPEGPGRSPAVLALHYERAGKAVQAFHYAVLAADEALRKHALREALDFYDRAASIAARDPQSPLHSRLAEVHAGQGRALQFLGDHPGASARYREMLSAAEQAGDLRQQARALNLLSTIQIITDLAVEDPEASLESALRLADAAGDQTLRAQTLWNLGLLSRFRDPERAVGKLKEALELTRQLPDSVETAEVQGHILNDLSIVEWIMCRLTVAEPYALEAQAIFRRLHHLPMLADALGCLAGIKNYTGDTAGAAQAAAEGLAIGRAIESPWAISYCLWGQATVALAEGRFEDAVELASEGEPYARRVRFPGFIAMSLSIRSEALLEMGCLSEALELALETTSLVGSTDSPAFTVLSSGLIGRVRLRLGELSEARPLLEPMWQEILPRGSDSQGLAFAAPALAELALLEGRSDYGLGFVDFVLSRFEPHGVWRWVGELRYWRARLLAQAGRLEEAEQDLLEADRRLRDGRVWAVTWCIDAAFASLYEAIDGGRSERAERALQRARQALTVLADGIHDDSNRTSFLARPEVASVLKS